MDQVCAEFKTSMAMLAVAATLLSGRAVALVRGDDDALRAGHRVVHRFDFDERAQGNLEQEPRFWTQVSLPGFPKFAVGGFDFDVGHASPPSFGLQCAGRSVAYQYRGPETGVRRNTDYRIEAFIKSEALNSGRACLSAHFLDAMGRPIAGTVVRSKYVGGAGSGDGWQAVEILLPSAPAHAATIGLMAWALQESQWSTSVKGRRHIRRVDVQGRVWFDDVTIFALPRAELSSGSTGNIMLPGTDQSLRVVVADFEDDGLRAELSIFAADGGLARIHRIRVSVGSDAVPRTYRVDDLNPGVYTSVLKVFSGTDQVVTRALTFVRLGPERGKSGSNGRSFGVVLDPRRRCDTAQELALIENLAVRSAKIPVWSGVASDAPSPAERQATDAFLQMLVRAGFSLTGVFAGPPGPIVQGDGPYPRPLLELLSGSVGTWQDHMAAVVVPNAGVFDFWQIGADTSAALFEPQQLEKALTQTRETIQRFMTLPLFALPTSMAAAHTDDLPPFDHHSLILDDGVAIDAFARIIADARAAYPGQVSVFLTSAPATPYRRIPRLARFARRIVEARFDGASTVYVAQPWSVRDTVAGRVAEPYEDYVVLRTIADMIGDAASGVRLRIAPGVVCLSFRSAETSTLVLWDPHSTQEGRIRRVQLGAAATQVNLWGEATPLAKDAQGRHLVRVSSTPTFIKGVENWLVDLRSSVRIEPNQVATGTELGAHTIEIPYDGSRALSGTLVLVGPQDWEISRQETPLHVNPQRVTQVHTTIRYPHNEVAGLHYLLARIKLARPDYYMELPLTLELALPDVDVAAMASRNGASLILTHTVTNRSSEMIDLRSIAEVPGRERQYRPLANIAPGDSQTVEFRFSKVDLLGGKTVHLSLRDVNDGPRRHNLELLIP